jgi:hypothetical protein
MDNRKVLSAAGVLAVAVVVGVAWAESPSGTADQPQDEQRVSQSASPRNTYEGASELQEGRISGGGGLGFLGSTPDGPAFAMNGNLDYFVNNRVSVGPLAQFAFTDDLSQVGLSSQAKYWLDVPGTQGRGRIALQSGIGFVHADLGRNDTSWLVPMGVGYDYTLNSGATLTATSLVNFTNLDTGAGSANVMPGVAFGIRF